MNILKRLSQIIALAPDIGRRLLRARAYHSAGARKYQTETNSPDGIVNKQL
jgi:hypothetical protein